MTEGKQRLNVLGVEPSISNEQTFRIVDLRSLPGYALSMVSRWIRKLLGKRTRQFARYIYIARKTSCHRITAFHSRIPGVKNGRNLGEPR